MVDVVVVDMAGAGDGAGSGENGCGVTMFA